MKNVIDLISTELSRLQRNYELAEGVNWKVHPKKEDMINDMKALNEAIKILSNEREGLGKHECKKKVCDYGFESNKLCNFECALTGCQLI